MLTNWNQGNLRLVLVMALSGLTASRTLGVPPGSSAPLEEVPVQSGTSEPDADSRHRILIRHTHLAEAPGEHVDPCAIDPEGAILLLTETEIASLKVPFERRGTLREYVRRFRPEKTMAAVGVPSISRILGDPQFGAAPRKVSAGSSFPLGFDRYHTPQEGLAAFQEIAAQFPHIARLEIIGRSVEQRDLWALRLSDQPSLEERGERKIFFCALHHAREWATHEAVLFMAQHLVTNYDTDPRVRNILDHSVVWILLCANPDGFQHSWDVDRFWRKNRRPNRDGTTFGVDLNRNYEYNWGYNNVGSSGSPASETYRGTAPASEPETQAVQSFLSRERPSLAITYHTYSQLVLFPWGYTASTLAQAHTSMRAIGERYASCAASTHGMEYLPGPAHYTIYPTNGDMTDYAYAVHGAMAFTPEMRPASSELGGFLLPEEEILPNNEENLAAALWLMDNVADARFVARPQGRFFGPSRTPFSLPLTPTSVKPERALEMPFAAAARLMVWFDDILHPAPGFGSYPVNFEGIDSGSALFFDAIGSPAMAWANSFTGYTALPYIFDEGSAVMIENYQPRPNYVGIPSEHPVRLSDLRIIKRVIGARGTDFGNGELILETRTALQDYHHTMPWISWNWTCSDYTGTTLAAHPEGRDGADEFLYPFRVYTFTSNVRSYVYDGSRNTDAVYLLLFPPAVRPDADGDGQVGPADFAALSFCFAQSGEEPWPEPCAQVDFNQDQVADLGDWAAFQNQFGSAKSCSP